MVAGGITRREATVPLLDPRAAQLAAREGITRTAAAMRLAVEETGAGAVCVVVGNAPTALFELLERPPATRR
jgi:precorrin-8X/cobalt-precorrin-8 methylmutase